MILYPIIVLILISSQLSYAREYFFEIDLESDYVTPYGMKKFPAYEQYNFKSDYGWGYRNSFNAAFSYEIAKGFYINPVLFFAKNEGYFKGHESNSELYGVGDEPVTGKVEYLFAYRSSDYGFALNGGFFLVDKLWISSGFDYRIPLKSKNSQYERIVSPADVYFLDEKTQRISRYRNQLSSYEDDKSTATPGFLFGSKYEMPLGSDANYNITIGTNFRLGLGEVSENSNWKDWEIGLSFGIRYYEEKYKAPPKELITPSLDANIFFAGIFSSDADTKKNKILELEITGYKEKRFLWSLGEFNEISSKENITRKYNTDKIKFYYEASKKADSIICKLSNGKSFIFPLNSNVKELEIEEVFSGKHSRIEARLFVHSGERMAFSKEIILEKKIKHLGQLSGIIIEFEGNLKSLDFSNIPDFGEMKELEIFSDKTSLAGSCSKYFDKLNPKVYVDKSYVEKYRSSPGSNKPILFLRFK